MKKNFIITVKQFAFSCGQPISVQFRKENKQMA